MNSNPKSIVQMCYDLTQKRIDHLTVIMAITIVYKKALDELEEFDRFILFHYQRTGVESMNELLDRFDSNQTFDYLNFCEANKNNAIIINMVEQANDIFHFL